MTVLYVKTGLLFIISVYVLRDNHVFQTINWPNCSPVMRTSWHGNTFRMTDSLWGESTDPQGLPSQKGTIMWNLDFLLVGKICWTIYRGGNFRRHKCDVPHFTWSIITCMLDTTWGAKHTVRNFTDMLSGPIVLYRKNMKIGISEFGWGKQLSYLHNGISYTCKITSLY